MAKGMKYSQEVKNRTVSLVNEYFAEHPGCAKVEAFRHVSSLVGVTSDTVKGWYHQQGAKPVAPEESAEIKCLKAQVRELEQTNQSLKDAAVFFLRRNWPPTKDLVAYIYAHKHKYSVKLMCKVFCSQGLKLTRSAYYKHKQRGSSSRSIQDEILVDITRKLYVENYSVYGYRKMHVVLNNCGYHIGRDQTLRIMKLAGIKGLHRADHKKPYTKKVLAEVERFPDLISRNWPTGELNQAWVADFTYVRTSKRFAYTAFVTDTASRRILAWDVGKVHDANLVARTVEYATLERQIEDNNFTAQGIIHHSDAGSEYRSIALQKVLEKYDMNPSIGSIGCAYDNSLMESTIGLYKTELIYKNQRRWHSSEEVALATAEWVHWYNQSRIHSSIGNQTPIQYEQELQKNS